MKPIKGVFIKKESGIIVPHKGVLVAKRVVKKDGIRKDKNL